jgi:hypothetical protein
MIWERPFATRASIFRREGVCAGGVVIGNRSVFQLWLTEAAFGNAAAIEYCQLSTSGNAPGVDCG